MALALDTSLALELLFRYRQGERNFNSLYLAKAALGCSDLKGVDLSYADLSKADLSQANLRGADLSYANLRDANLTGADLRGSSLIGADLRGAHLEQTHLAEADYLPGVTRFPANFHPAQAQMHSITTAAAPPSKSQ